MDRFSRTIFAYDISAFTKFARNWRHESPGGRFLLPFQSVDNARLITPQLCARMNIRNDAHSEGESSVPLLSLLFSPVFCPFSFANIHNSSLRIYAKYMTRSNHVKGNSLMVCTCIASYVTSRALHTMSSSSTVSVVYRGKRGDITPLFRSARSRSFMFDQKRMSRAEGIYSISEKKTAEKMLCCQRLL